ncbi:hypothetical protein CSKR_108902 [Clonorchis sinensis]|uniref:Uncharacterized protein n=2 Tax=Clonorchis sinensis TaxID=79923 RepID=A0A8T1MD24_CLOSI|nr:hypothetical protein CSKR_108902 [Clonorchis sinensis]GAA36714.1 hypothetical protein CLF_111657 [Clonorchis sinensis]
MPVQELDSGVASEEEFHSLADVTCNCELCHARLYVSSKQNVIEDSLLDHSDAFHLLPSPKSGTPNPPQFPAPIFYPWSCPMPVYTDISPFACGSFNKCFCPNGNKINPDMAGHMNPICEFPCRPNVGLLAFDQEGDVSSVCTVPQVYISKDCVLHIRLSAYVSFERSVSAFRLINYRNNSALALNESGEYGYAYHYNCRGLINMHHGKLSITFDKDRQVLLRTEKPSFVKKEMEFYRLTSHHWTACRPVSMDTFDRDRTPEILKKIGIEKSLDDAKLRELVSSSAVHKTGCGLVIYLGDAKIEQKVNGDVVLSWFYEDRANSLIVSPLSGSFSLSTKNLEIMATPRSDIYIAFGDFFVHVGSQQMTVSSGAVAGRCNFTKSHPCLLKLTSTIVENQAVDLRQYCAYSQSVGQTGPTPTGSHHRRQTPITSSAFSGNVVSSYCSISHPNRNVSPASQTSASGETTSDKRDDTTCSSSSKEAHITNVKSDTSILAGPKSTQPAERG